MSQRFKKVSFVRPFTRVGEEGWPVKPAVVTYGRREYERRMYPVFPDFDKSPMKEYTSKFQHKLILNLWLVVLYFEWVGKEKRPPNAAS